MTPFHAMPEEPLCYTGVKIATPFRMIHDGAIVVSGGVIDQVGPREALDIPESVEPTDLPGRTIIPGMIDLHLHGIVGRRFDEAGPEDLEAMASALLERGTTGALITLLPAPPEQFFENLRRVRSYLESPGRSFVFQGIHCEGPFLNPAMHGAIRREDIWASSEELSRRIFDEAGPWLKLMTIAPEVHGAMNIIRRGRRNGVVMSAGHSEADYRRMERAIDNGLAQVTHIFNAMPLAHHREPGVLGAAYIHQELKVQLIADGVHVHPVTIRLLAMVKGIEGIVLVSDATPACGLPDGRYELRGQSVELRDGRAYLDDGTLAGSATALDAALPVLVNDCEIPLAAAARMASLNPARALHLDDRKGVLAVGFDADFVALGPGLKPEITVVGGRVAYRKP